MAAVGGPGAPSLGDVAAAREELGATVRRTPVLPAPWLESIVGGTILLKGENLQATGSFKVRGAATKLNALDRRHRGGVVTASAGNHGHALAFVAARKGIACRVYAPAGAAVSKERAVRSWGGEWERGGASVDECLASAHAYAQECDALLVHPFDDPDVIRGGGTLGAELAEQVGEIGTVIVPVGGGGLIGGVAAVLKQLRPEVRVVGVQVDTCAPLASGEPPADDVGFSIADGIAVKAPGKLTRPLIESYVDDLEVVSEDAIAEAMGALAGQAKLVVEGAGAVGVAALMTGTVKPARAGTTLAVLTGGNVDLRRLSAIARLHEVRAGVNLRVATRVADRPGALADLLASVARTEANVLTVEHLRDTGHRSFRETGIELVLETRGTDHGECVLESLASDGFSVTVVRD